MFTRSRHDIIGLFHQFRILQQQFQRLADDQQHVVANEQRPGCRLQRRNLFKEQQLQRRHKQRLRRLLRLFRRPELDLVRSESLDLQRPCPLGNPHYPRQTAGCRPSHVPFRLGCSIDFCSRGRGTRQGFQSRNLRKGRAVSGQDRRAVNRRLRWSRWHGQPGPWRECGCR